MELDRLLQSLEDYLSPLVSPMGGSVQVSLDPWDTNELLKTGPGKWRVILSPEGEAPVEEPMTGGWVAGQIVAYVQAARGLTLPGSKSLHRATPSRPTSCLALAATVRGLLRGVSWEDPEINGCTGLMFGGAEWLVDGADEKQGWRVRALRFSVFYLLDSATSGDSIPEVVGQYLRIPTDDGVVQARMVFVNSTTSPTIRLSVALPYLYVTHPGGTHRVRLLAT